MGNAKVVVLIRTVLMATLIPSFSRCSSKMTAGDRRFARCLEEKLDESCLPWYDVPVGAKRLHPDFILLHPDKGIIVFEVKDWKLESIESVTASDVQLLTESGIKTLKNPLQQARDYALAINQLLEKDAALIQSSGPYKGKLSVPYGYGVVLSNITRKVFNTVPALSEIIDSHLVICKDEFTASADMGVFQERLWAMLPYEFGTSLSQVQIDRVRWNLFPELRITAKQLELLSIEFEASPDEKPEPLDLIQILDLQQEQLARSLGEGHRVVHGVAGSGKTLILAYRAHYLAESTQRPILILCFNVSLAAHLEGMIQAKGPSAYPILVRHFHGWCKDLLQTYRIGLPDRTQYTGSDYVNQLVLMVTKAVASGCIPSGLYGAVLIDEGHDFEAEWLRLATQMVSPKSNSFLFLYDDTQSLYVKKQRRQFSFKSVGIQAQGRTTILKVNYRNPAEILDLAYTFVRQDELSLSNEVSDRPRLKPQSAGKRGAVPESVMMPSFGREAVYVAQRIKQFHEQGIAWNEIAIIYRTKFMGGVLLEQLKQAAVPVEWLNRDSRSRSYDPQLDSVKVLTMHASKGLEFSVVCIPGIGYLPSLYGEESAEKRLLYVAMTRATERLLLTAHQPSEYVQRIEVGLQAIS